MKVKCPGCGKEFVVGGLGRKRLPVALAFVCKALQLCAGNYSEAARVVSNELGEKVSPGFVMSRIKRAGLTKEDVINGKGDKIIRG